MIDGFGWFERADFLRAFLFFDEVEYILPKDTAPPLHYGLQVYESPQYRAAHTELGSEELDLLIQRSLFDARRGDLRVMVERLPKRDVKYAALVVQCDAELKLRLPRRALDDTFAIAFLSNKLLFHAARSGAVPIVGRRYATEFLTRKLETWTNDAANSSALTPATPQSALNYSTFAAGLSMSFIPDASLIEVPFDTLQAFKAKNGKLLEKHQLHLLETAERFSSLPQGPELAAQLGMLRAEAAKHRAMLDEEARDVWSSLGVDMVKNSMISGSTALVTSLAVLRGITFDDLLTAAIPAAIAGSGAAIAAVVEAGAKMRAARRGTMAYLFEAERALRGE